MLFVIRQGHHAVDGDDALRSDRTRALQRVDNGDLVRLEVVPPVIHRVVTGKSDAGDGADTAAQGDMPRQGWPGDGDAHPALNQGKLRLVLAQSQHRSFYSH